MEYNRLVVKRKKQKKRMNNDSSVLLQDGLTNIKGALFYYISELTYSTVYGIQTFMPADFPLLVREYHDGIYPVICYYVAKVNYFPNEHNK